MTFFVRDQKTLDIQHNAEELERLSDGLSLEGENLLDLHVNSLTVVNETKMEDNQIIDGDLFVTGKIQVDKNITSEQSIISKNIVGTTQIKSDGILKVTGDSSLANVTVSGDATIEGNLEVNGTGGIIVQGGDCTVAGDVTVAGSGTFSNISASGSGTFGTATVGGSKLSTTFFEIARLNKTNAYTVISGSDNDTNPDWTVGCTYLQEVNLTTPVDVGSSIEYSICCTGPITSMPFCIVQNIVGGNTSGTNLVSVNVLFYCLGAGTGSFDQYIGITHNL